MSRFTNTKCCKPLPNEKCSKILKNITPNNYKTIIKFKNMCEEEMDKYRICSTCEIKVREKKEEITEPLSISTPKQSTADNTPTPLDSGSSTSSNFSSSDNGEEVALKKQKMLEVVNTALSVEAISPIYTSRIQRKNEREKIETVASCIKQSLLNEHIIPLSETQTHLYKSKCYDEMLTQLKSKFRNLTNNADRIQLLTVLPVSLPQRKIAEEFNCSQHLVRISKKLLETEGAFSKPGPKKGRPLSEDVITLVKDFYEDDEISRLMPGKNDCITIRNDGNKQNVQKRLMLSTMKESYQEFKKRYPTTKVGFSKFSLLKPKYCVQLGASGTHSVCVCAIHQNVKLMMANATIPDITDGEFNDYKSVISYVLCQNPKPNCYLLKCSTCPGINQLKIKLNDCFEKHELYEDAEIIFNQWISTDRCQLETLTKSTEDFIAYFVEKLEKLIPHHFISFQQSNFIKETKIILKPNEFLVCCDFSENYSFVIQNEVQGYHWNNAQATIHPFVIYYRDGNGTLQHISYVIISDCLTHDSISVSLFIDKLIVFLKSKFEIISKIIYLSDGAASQYKN